MHSSQMAVFVNDISAYACARPWGQLMELPRRQFLRLASGTAALPAVSRFAWAQAYPTRPVHVIVGFTAGNNIDIVARLIGQWLSERLGQPFIIENPPGASRHIAPAAGRAAPAARPTLLMTGALHPIHPTPPDHPRL